MTHQPVNWPFPPASGPVPWTKQQEREYQQALRKQQQKEQQELPEAPF